MGNSSFQTHFTLGAYSDTGPWRWLCFVVLLLMFALILASNLLLVVVIVLKRSLHRPMFLLLCSLLLNELCGGVALFPLLLLQVVQDTHQVPATMCFVQIFFLYSYTSVEFTNLAVISYDRYLAICFPLQYAARMHPQKMVALVAVIWLPPFAAVGVTTLLTAALTLCGDVIDKVYCDNYSIVKLSCSEAALNNWYELVAASVTVLLPLVVILVTYFRILRVCFRGSAQMRQKALTTCTPHLCSLINFAFGVLFEVLQNRFDMSALPQELRIFISLYFFTCQPLFNPLMYGLKLAAIRHECRSVLFGVRCATEETTS